MTPYGLLLLDDGGRELWNAGDSYGVCGSYGVVEVVVVVVDVVVSACPVRSLCVFNEVVAVVVVEVDVPVSAVVEGVLVDVSTVVVVTGLTTCTVREAVLALLALSVARYSIV